MALSRINSSMIGAGDVSNTEHAYLNSVSSNVQTQIDGAGVADVKFQARNSSTDSNVTGNTGTPTIDFDTETFDTGSNFASDTFTAPSTGQYLLITCVTVSGITSAGTFGRLNIITSNRTYSADYDPQNTASVSGRGGFHLSVIADMDASDTATVRFESQNESSDVHDIHGEATNSPTYFCGALLA